MHWKILFVVVIVWALWDAAVPLFGIRQEPPWRLRARLEAGNAPVMLDVRTPAEYAWFHIPGSVNIPFPPPAPEELGIGPDDEVVLICMTGHRSPVAAWRLKRQGISHVANLTWGVSMYKILGGKTVPGAKP